MQNRNNFRFRRNRFVGESSEGGEADGGGERHQVRRSGEKIGHGKINVIKGSWNVEPETTQHKKNSITVPMTGLLFD